MALRDSFGFLSLPRAGWEVASLEARRSHHESEASTMEASTLKAWASVRLPSLDGPVDNAIVEQANKQLVTLKTLVRSDDPGRSQRAKLWYLASGGLAKHSAASAAQPPVSYARLAASASELPEQVIVQVDTDVRTVGLSWRQHPLFKTTQGISALSNIMVALLASNARLQYSRQLTHLVAFTLVVFGATKEEQVFWTVSALLEDKLFGYCQGQWQLGVRVEQEVLSRLAARKLPRLAAHLASLRLSVASFTQPWLSGLFVAHLPPETLARVWDAMMVEGPKVLLRTGLALLKMYEQTLSSCSFPEVLRKVLDLRVSRTTDAPALMTAAFKGCGSLPGNQVNILRQEALRSMIAPNSVEAIPRSSPTGGRATSPQGPRSGDLSGGASAASWSLFGAGSTSARRRSSGTGSSSALPSSYNSGSTTLATPSSPGGSGSESGAGNSESREPSPTQVVHRRSRSVQAMLARLVGGVKAAAAGGGGLGTEAGTVAEMGMRRSATASSVPALAAF